MSSTSGPQVTATLTVFNNNIFVYDSLSTGSYNGIFVNNSVFNNNLVYSSGGVVVSLPPDPVDSLNSGSNNINSADPQFTTGRLSNGIVALASPELDAYSWHLKSTSPGHNAGADGTDVGIYGGLYPMPNLEGVTTLPQIRRMDILNQQVPHNGVLSVHAVGTTRN
jgi:hypothetical protein